MKKKDLTGLRFGKLTVKTQNGVNKWGNTIWLCECDCGNETTVVSGSLTNGFTNSCGCLGSENLKKLRDSKIKFNKFEINGDVIIVELSNTKNKMVCDVSDWNKLKEYCWYENTNGYARSRIGYFHKVVCEVEYPFIVDHINRNKLDNRRMNLRKVTRQQNALNTDATGISWNKNAKKWSASIMIDGKHVHLGLFDQKEKARNARLEYEKSLNL